MLAPEQPEPGSLPSTSGCSKPDRDRESSRRYGRRKRRDLFGLRQLEATLRRGQRERSGRSCALTGARATTADAARLRCLAGRHRGAVPRSPDAICAISSSDRAFRKSSASAATSIISSIASAQRDRAALVRYGRSCINILYRNMIGLEPADRHHRPGAGRRARRRLRVALVLQRHRRREGRPLRPAGDGVRPLPRHGRPCLPDPPPRARRRPSA